MGICVIIKSTYVLQCGSYKFRSQTAICIYQDFMLHLHPNYMVQWEGSCTFISGRLISLSVMFDEWYVSMYIVPSALVWTIAAPLPT